MTARNAVVPFLTLQRLTKTFGTHDAVADLSLDMPSGEILCLLGPSGCGKSTLLRLIAGFETPTGGAIRLDGTDLTGLAPHRRPVNMMFQSYALFPHLSVARNIAYGLKGLGRSAASARVDALLRLVRMDEFGNRAPETLSGGQRQRVALARALAREPKVLLLDEPLGALDRGLREETQGELRAIQRRLGTAFVIVTHDPSEAMALADRIGVMDKGRLVQIGRPETLYERPVNRFVAGLLGDVNLIPGTVGETDGALVRVETALGPVLALGEGAPAAGAPALVALRPERIGASPVDPMATGDRNALDGHVEASTYLGDRIRLQIRMVDGSTIRATLPAGAGIDGGVPVRLSFTPDAATVMAA
ncbi:MULTISPECIES: ABC transporter ATP-binding protein [Methylobacterium]|uniref:ABC transporter ATP-binding protein n=2 Tax=Methylobacteriaceae TaxID=119045 RepID=UPI0006F8CB01|nr:MULTISPECIES: ABC transporter ATP-binding protein [Methylobacterium]KQO42361.1 ABC transporter ATP-binding protein [Methylobacterium sp. Leaf85]MBD8901459.1 ABC transporter ATP-binding protein [Methylobacterium bullatum]